LVCFILDVERELWGSTAAQGSFLQGIRRVEDFPVPDS
jgi:hypothetical protein